ncbi:hypothetical protein EV639_101740 [Rathayibacter tanaceti]|uniref:Uncharacterized protein n=1 Tax=Rathayibacter tanaceti TaxID=1671680 RepID=A0ACD2XQG3_9MICO|nr:hypothetical protein EV639_101740 [Rathayibacter tanaceti]
MMNDSPLPLSARLLIILLAHGLSGDSDRSFRELAEALGRELAPRALPRLLLGLRRHLLATERRAGRAVTPPAAAPAPPRDAALGR